MKHAWSGVMRLGMVVLSLVASATLIVGCGSGGSGGGGTPSATVQTGTVSGQVASAANGSAVAGATVSTTTSSTTSAADGSFTVAAGVGDRTVVHVEATGFAEAFPVARVTAGQTTTLGVKLLAVGVTTPVTVNTGGIVTVPKSTAQVDLPANGLVPKNGGAVAGSVNVSVTPINPAVDPNLMPGDFSGVSAGGTTPIESFGAMLIDIRDNAGTRYNLAPGKTSTIRIPLGTLSLNPPATLPLWFFDEATGLWNEEGTATLTGTAPNQYYEGVVSHFSYWNADKGWTSVFVTGCVRDSNNQPVANLMVQANGLDYSGSDFDFTAADGTFRVAVRQGSTASVSGAEWDFQTFTTSPRTNVVNVGPSLVDVVLPNCLIKNAGPLTVTTAVLPGGNVGAAYNQTLAASGGVPGYVWSLNAGSALLPTGLSLNPTGVISGTPTTAGQTTIVVKVTDSVGGIATKQLSVTINPPGVVPVTITTVALPAGIVSRAYTIPLTSSGGTPPLSWTVVSGSGALPDGLTLNPSTGQINGTPTTPGTSTFTIRVEDSGTLQQSDQKPFSLTINAVSSGGGGGTLAVANAPVGVGGTFVANSQVSGSGSFVWLEGDFSSGVPSHYEAVVLFSDPTTGVNTVSFQVNDTGVLTNHWLCGSSISVSCQGVITVNRLAGTAIFSGVVAPSAPGFTAPSITLNGTLNFTPF